MRLLNILLSSELHQNIKRLVIVHQCTEVVRVTVVVGVHHGGLDNVEPGPDGVRDDVLHDHHEDSSSRDLVTNKLPGPDRQRDGETRSS